MAVIISDSEEASAITLPWHKLDRLMIQVLRAELGRRYKLLTANRYLAALRAVLKESWRLSLIDSDTYFRISDIPDIKGSRVQSGRLVDREDIIEILEHFQGGETYAEARNFVMIAIMYYAGLRRGELCDLTFGDWNGRLGKLLIHGKGNKERFVYLYGIMLDTMIIWVGLHDDCAGADPLFARALTKARGEYSGEKMPNHTPYHVLRRAQKVLGMEKFTPHDLRRTCFTNLLEKGVDLGTVAKIAGHANLSTTARYDMRDEKAKREAFKLLDLPIRA